MALAGSVNLLLSPRVTAAFSETGVLSPGGQCKSFDEDADGYVRAEGAGNTSRFTLPSGDAQQDVCRAALRRAGVDPAAVGMIEAHGTGTRAGDLVELKSLKAQPRRTFHLSARSTDALERTATGGGRPPDAALVRSHACARARSSSCAPVRAAPA